jgi:hypothetical protein
VRKRLQVLLEDWELRELQRIAKTKRTSVAEWVRQVLREASRQEQLRDADKKLGVVRAAVRHAFPTADVGQVLAELERGYVAEVLQ